MGNAALHPSMPMSDYLSGPWWTRSKLELAWRDPHKAFGLYVAKDREPDPPGEELAIGCFVNDTLAGLGPRVITVNVGGSKTKAYREAVADSQGGLVLTTRGVAIANKCREAIERHPWWIQNVRDSKHTKRFEQTITYDCPVTGLASATRTDWIVGRCVIEVKTTAGGKRGGQRFRDWWPWEMRGYGYHRQLAQQLEALRELTDADYSHVQLVVEKPKYEDMREDDWPPVRLYTLPEDGHKCSLAVAREETYERRRRVQEMLKTGVWTEPECLEPRPLVYLEEDA